VDNNLIPRQALCPITLKFASIRCGLYNSSARFPKRWAANSPGILMQGVGGVRAAGFDLRFGQE